MQTKYYNPYQIADMVNYYNNQGHQHWANGFFSQAVDCYLKALEELNSQEDQYKNPYNFAMIYYYLAETYRLLGDSDSLNKYYLMIKGCVDQSNQDGFYYKENGDFVQAIACHQRAIDILSVTNTENLYDRSMSYSYIADVFKLQDSLNQQAHYSTIRAFINDLNNNGIIYRENENFAEAVEFYEQAIAAMIDNNIFDDALVVYNELFISYQKLAEINKLNGDLILAINCYNRIIEVNNLLSQHDSKIDKELSAINNNIVNINAQISSSLSRGAYLGSNPEEVESEDDISELTQDIIHTAAQEGALINIVAKEFTDNALNDAIGLVVSKEVAREKEARDKAAAIAQQEEILSETVVDKYIDKIILDMVDFACSRKKQNHKKKNRDKIKAEKVKEAEKAKENHLKDQVKKLNDLAIECLKEGNFAQAIVFFTEGLKLNQIMYPNNIHADVADSYSYLGDAYLAKSAFTHSDQFYIKSKNIYEKLANQDGIKIASDKLSLVNDLQAKLITANNNYDLPYVVFFSIKELIEKSASIKYFATEILHLDYLLPASIKQIELPEFSYLFWIIIHCAAFNLGMRPLIGNEFSKTIFLASSIYGFKLSLNDFVVSQKQSYISNRENKLENFIDKCGYLIALQASVDSLNKEVNKLIIPDNLDPFPYATVIMGITIEGMECYKLHKQQEVIHQPSIISKIIPYVADITAAGLTLSSVMSQNLYLRGKYANNNKLETIMKMVQVVEGFMILNTVVAVDHLSKLVVFTVEETIIYPMMEYFGETYNYYFPSENL